MMGWCDYGIIVIIVIIATRTIDPHHWPGAQGPYSMVVPTAAHSSLFSAAPFPRSWRIDRGLPTTTIGAGNPRSPVPFRSNADSPSTYPIILVILLSLPVDTTFSMKTNWGGFERLLRKISDIYRVSVMAIFDLSSVRYKNPKTEKDGFPWPYIGKCLYTTPDNVYVLNSERKACGDSQRGDFLLQGEGTPGTGKTLASPGDF